MAAKKLYDHVKELGDERQQQSYETMENSE